jgi:hypothetical protein
MSDAKIQHYVPRFLLRMFGSGKKDRVWTYDKLQDRAFQTNAKNIAAESRFYDFYHNGSLASLESALAALESATKPVIDRLLRADSLLAVPDDQRLILTEFVSVQLTRTRAFREQWKDFPRLLSNHLKANDKVATGSQAEDLIRELTENESKEQTARFTLSAPSYFGQHLASKVWVLLATTRRHPFILSDNPVTMQNLMDRSPPSNLGLAVPGIEIYLPLSPTRALGMWCPTLAEAVRVRAGELRSAPHLAPQDVASVFALEEAIDRCVLPELFSSQRRELQFATGELE